MTALVLPYLTFTSPLLLLQLYAVARQLGVKLALITGARLSTTLQRLPFLPAADAIVAESGGRIYYPGNLPTACPLQVRRGWSGCREIHAGRGPGPAAGSDARQPLLVACCGVASLPPGSSF